MKKTKKILFIFLTIFCSCLNILILVGTVYYFLKFNEFRTVRFNSNGGTTVENKIVKTGSLLVLPTNLKKVGFEFLGWEIDGNLVKNSIIVDKNINLIAKWKAIKVYTYSIRFLNEDGTLYSRQLVKENGLAYTPKKPYKYGYIFEYWTLNGEKFDFSNPITSDLELYPMFTERVVEDFEGIVDEGYDQEIIEN